jgi:hypothetical protein
LAYENEIRSLTVSINERESKMTANQLITAEVQQLSDDVDRRFITSILLKPATVGE